MQNFLVFLSVFGGIKINTKLMNRIFKKKSKELINLTVAQNASISLFITIVIDKKIRTSNGTKNKTVVFYRYSNDFIILIILYH